MSLYQSSYRLLVAAQADSTFLCHVCGLLATLSVVPQSFYSRRHGEDASEIILIIELIGVTARQVDLLERKLSRITLVVAIECERITADLRYPTTS